MSCYNYIKGNGYSNGYSNTITVKCYENNEQEAIVYRKLMCMLNLLIIMCTF